MNKKVKKCTNSNLVEACVFMLGSPSAYEEQEISAFIVSIKDKLKNNEGFKQIKGNVKINPETSKPIIPPFSQDQFMWDNNTKIARLGHQFISIHTIHKTSNKYQTYNESLKPVVGDILDSINDERSFNLSQLIFQYVNRFQFNEKKSLNLSEHFHFSAGINQEAGIGLSNLQLKFKDNTSSILRTNNSNTSFEVNVSYGLDKGKLVLIVNTIGRKNLSNIQVKDKKIFIEIDKLRELTKECFFKLMQEKTKREMGVQYE